MPFIPHTDDDIKEMLATIGVESVDALFDEIPKALIVSSLSVAPGMSEMDISREMQQRAKQDEGMLNFIGAGAYEHHIPAVVWDIASRGEFMTSYTPYQAEASQGTLQLLYEFQTMMANLTGMDVSNASMYDGASALAEAVLMAIRCHKNCRAKRVLIPTTLHPHYRKVLQAILKNQQIDIVEIPFAMQDGKINSDLLSGYQDQEITALVIPQPNFFGSFEAVDELTKWAHQHNMLVIACVNPIALGLIQEPGSWGDKGADIVCGEAQPLGIPLASGGPYAGFLCCKKEFVRQLPGRLVGRTVDQLGKPGFTLTLQAREQHIRRSKATSNICTNQGLLVTAATLYMSLLGGEGLRQVALASHHNTQRLVERLTSIVGVSRAFVGPHFHEAVIRLTSPVDEVLTKLAALGIQGGYSLKNDYPELGDALLLCATETKNEADIEKYYQALQKITSLSNLG